MKISAVEKPSLEQFVQELRLLISNSLVLNLRL